MKPFSQIGVLRTRSGPNFSGRPSFVLKTPPAVATSSPMQKHGRVVVELVLERGLDRLAVGQLDDVRVGRRPDSASSCVDIGLRSPRGSGRAPRRRARLPASTSAWICLAQAAPASFGVERAVGGELRAEQVDRVALASSARARPRHGTSPGRCASGRGSGRSSPRSASGPRRPRARAIAGGHAPRDTASTSWPSTITPGIACAFARSARSSTAWSSRAAGCTRRRGCSRSRTRPAPSRPTPC